MTPASHDPALAAWDVDADDFPLDAPVDRQLVFLLRYAVLAPSAHNTQPWRFEVDGPEVALHADRSRGLPVVDPDDRALVISCGAALGTLEVAAGHFGFALSLDDLPGDGADDLLARIRVMHRSEPDPGPDPAFEAITRRRTSRAAFGAQPVPAALCERLGALADGSRGWLTLTDDPETHDRIAHLVARGDRAQMADSRFRRELASWVRSSTGRRADGVDGGGLTFDDVMAQPGPFVLRTFDLGDGRAAQDADLARGGPLLAVLGTDEDGPLEWLCAGRALSRVLLAATAAGLSTGYLNQAIEVPELRPRLAEASGRTGAHPQLLLRLGYGPVPGPEPRRPFDEVVAVR